MVKKNYLVMETRSCLDRQSLLSCECKFQIYMENKHMVLLYEF